MIRRLIDAHHHLWNLEQQRYPWLHPPATEGPPDDLAPLRRSYEVVEYLTDAAAVPLVGSVHVEAAFDRDDPVAETRWIAGQAAQYAIPTVAVAAVRLQQPDLDSVLRRHCEFGLVRGVRQMLNWTAEEPVAERDGLLGDRAWLAGLVRLAAFGMSFDLQIFPHQLHEAARVVAAHPDVNFIVDHGGYCQRETPERNRMWLSGITELGRHQNVFAKASGYASVDPSVNERGLRRFVAVLLDAFGPSRTMFASNFPVDRPRVSYAQLISRYDAAVSDLADADRDSFFYGTARRAYRIAETSLLPRQS